MEGYEFERYRCATVPAKKYYDRHQASYILSESCWFEMTTNEEKQNPLLGLDSIVGDDASEMV